MSSKQSVEVRSRSAEGLADIFQTWAPIHTDAPPSARDPSTALADAPQHDSRLLCV